MGVLHEVRPHPPGKRPPLEAQLAWKIAELAAGERPLDPKAAETAANRVIDNAAVAVAAVNLAPATAARGQALCFPKPNGATVFGVSSAETFDPLWAAFANGTAVRDLDFHDSFFAKDSSHPADVIAPLVAVAQSLGLGGEALARGIVVAYEVQISLTKGIALNVHRIDHVAHLGPAVAAGIGAMLRLGVQTIYEAVQLAAHLSLSTRQVRKGRISTWKASAPAHVGKCAIEAVDRAMRGETGPSPIWEGDYGIIAVLLGGPESVVEVPLPADGEPCLGILESYPKAYAAGYHGQALIDLALRLRPKLHDLDRIQRVELRTKRLTHVVMGAGSGDPDKWDPAASRETLDHSSMFLFARALVDGGWDHHRSYDPKRLADPDFVRLWHTVTTVEDPIWNERFDQPPPLDKAHGARAVITYDDGVVIEDELLVADSHPRGTSPWQRADYERKFVDLTATLATEAEQSRFLKAAASLAILPLASLVSLNVALPAGSLATPPKGLFDRARTRA